VRDVDADEVPCGLIEFDAEGRILASNAVFAEWVGTADVVGRALEDFVDSADPGAVLVSGDIVFLRRRDGARRPVLVERSADGRTAVVFDATRRQEVEDGFLRSHALVRRTQNRLQLVIDASIAFADTRSEAELAGILADTVARAYAAEESIVFLADEEDRLVHAAGTYPFGDLPFAELIELPELALGDVVKISGVEAAFAIAAPIGRAFTSAGVHSTIVAPILHERVLLGVFACFFLHPREFDEQASPLASALAGQAGQVITTLRLQRRLEHAATHDETTGLPNRRFLEERLRNSDSRTAGWVAILFVDLDGFKLVNDRLGHSVGDRVLREVGQRLRTAVRDTDIVARYGGDEFVVVAEVADADAADALAERIRCRVEEPYGETPFEVPVTASIGLALADGSEPVATDQLIRLADQAMYNAKSAGGNRTIAAPVIEPPAA
jgi:diguanylate cyclase (GGDEF)-like protein